MSRPPTLEPRWLVGLLSQWAMRTSRDRGLGYPTICVMLRSGIPGRVESYEPTGYGSADFRALEASLRILDELHLLAVMRYFKPWGAHIIDAETGISAPTWTRYLQESLKALVVDLDRKNLAAYGT